MITSIFHSTTIRAAKPFRKPDPFAGAQREVELYIRLFVARNQEAVDSPRSDLERNRHSCYRTFMNLTLPQSIESRLTPATAALPLALGLFIADEATLGQAAEVAGMSQADFLKELGRRHISIHYGADELADDLRTLDILVPDGV